MLSVKITFVTNSNLRERAAIMQNISSAERMSIALKGGRPDRVPLFLVHDERYGIRAQKKSVRDFFTATPEEMTKIAEKIFYMHPCDAFLSEIMYGFDFHDRNVLEDIQGDFHIYREKDTGELFKMDNEGSKFMMDGQIRHDMPVSNESLITCKDDIVRLVPKNPPVNFDSELGFFAPARRIATKNPGHHIASEITSPFARAVWRCGGYEAGLCLVYDDPELMVELMIAEMELELKRLPAMVAAGVKSVYLTSFFTGSDTISPDIYRNIVLPIETEVINRVHAAGLFAIYWFLGNMQFLIDDFRKLPFDALAPEQPRKGYEVSYKTLRDTLGSEVCIMAHTREEDIIGNSQDSIREYFDTQYNESGRNGAFIAGVTITPENANPNSLDYYASVVDEYVY